MKQLEVQIMGQSYLLGCPDGGEDSLRSAVTRVDAAMCKIRDAGKVKARDRIAVLAALNLTFEHQSDQEKAQANEADLTKQLNQAKRAKAPVPVIEAETTARDPASAMNPEESQRLLALLARMDASLGDDGQLI
jgi:cell division protein ZapA